MTHDTLPELKWRPIAKTEDKVPSKREMEEAILLREWEIE